MNPALIIGISSALIAGVAGWTINGWRLTSDYEAQIHAMQSEAATNLQTATAQAIEIERQHNVVANQLEVANAKNRKKLDSVLAENRRLAHDLGGMRDPYPITSSCTLSSTPDTATGTTPAATAGRLSDEASEFLLEFARDADRAAEYANTCREWIRQLNGTAKSND